MDNVKADQYVKTIKLSDALDKDEFKSRANEVYANQDQQKIAIQEISCLAVAAYLSKKHGDYGRPRQLESLACGLYRCGGVDMVSWGDWVQKLVNVTVVEQKNNPEQPYKVTKAVKGEDPKRLYTGNVRKWWTSKKAKPVANVVTVEQALRVITNLADVKYEGVSTPEARKFAKNLLAVDGMTEMITAAKQADATVIDAAKKVSGDDKEKFLEEIKAVNKAMAAA